MDNNVNLNQAECIQSASNIGSTVYHNVCSGLVHVVPWGSLDWAAFLLLAAMALLLAATVLSIVFGIMRGIMS